MSGDSARKLSGREQALVNAEWALSQNNNSWSDLHSKGKLRDGVIVIDEDAPKTKPITKPKS
jgi:hypothetical protein